jgi:hypothetical protein
MLVHSVFFYAAADATQGQIDQLVADCYSLLAKIPGVHSLWVGPPAMTPRAVVDNTYGAALCVVLEGSAAHDVYQTHPLHLEFIARNKGAWQRVQVYDFFSK